MTEQVTAIRVLELLELVVNREGADTKRPCRYVEIDEESQPVAPLCIAACVFAELSVPLDIMAKFGSKTVSYLSELGLLDDIVDMSPDAVSVLARAQQFQDAHYPWSIALVHAQRHAWELGVVNAEDPDKD